MNKKPTKRQVKKTIIGEIEIPSYLSIKKAEEPFLKDILETKPKKSWTKPDIAKAVELAKTMATIERLHKQIAKEGDIIIDMNGKEIEHPAHKLLDSVTKRIIALSRSIHIHAEATQGRARDALGAKKIREIEAERISEKFKPIAPPNFKVIGGN